MSGAGLKERKDASAELHFPEGRRPWHFTGMRDFIPIPTPPSGGGVCYAKLSQFARGPLRPAA